MKKSIATIFLLISMLQLDATWNVVKINNQSDLQFSKAARANDVEIQSISKVFQKPDGVSSANNFFIGSDAWFGSLGGCKIIANNSQGDQMQILFLGDPTHRVANGRAKYSDKQSRKNAGNLKHPMMARVFIVQGNSTKLIGYAPYEKKNQKFALVFTGRKGNYKVQFLPL